MNSKKVLRYYSACGKGFWKKQMCLLHEINCKCWSNPRHRTCKTCLHGDHKTDSDGYRTWSYWDCEEGVEEHTGGPDGVDYISVNCRLWKSKEQG